MTDDDFYKDGYEDWHKNEKSNVIWWTAPIDQEGNILFSFDKKTVFDFYSDYPGKLTAEQIKIFRKENPVLAELKPTPEANPSKRRANPAVFRDEEDGNFSDQTIKSAVEFVHLYYKKTVAD